MNKTREEMIENGRNLDWCRPYKHRTENIYFILCEGKIIYIFDNNEEIYEDRLLNKRITELAKKLNSDYNDYNGWCDLAILLDSDFVEIGCMDCPCFKTCDAMNDN